MGIATTTDRWTCPEPDCQETVTGNSQARRTAQYRHSRRHGTADQPRLCTQPRCGKPFSPDHDRNAPGPTARHSFTTADMVDPRTSSSGDLIVPRGPRPRLRKR